MKHCKKGRTLGRNAQQRKALLRTLAGSLVMEKRIVTTVAKAKELRPYFERIITLVKRSNLPHVSVRKIQSYLPAIAVTEIVRGKEQFCNRNGGYTRIVKIGRRNHDAAEMAIIEIV